MSSAAVRDNKQHLGSELPKASALQWRNVDSANEKLFKRQVWQTNVRTLLHYTHLSVSVCKKLSAEKSNVLFIDAALKFFVGVLSPLFATHAFKRSVGQHKTFIEQILLPFLDSIVLNSLQSLHFHASIRLDYTRNEYLLGGPMSKLRNKTYFS